MIKEISRERLRELHKEVNPEIPFKLFEWNYGWRTVDAGHSLVITEGSRQVLFFTNAHEYFDKRKPNEIQTTD